MLTFLVAFMFFTQNLFANSKNNNLKSLSYSYETQLKMAEDVGYFYGYIDGSRCLYLFRISLGSRLDYSGRSVETFDISLVNEFNSEGFQTMICPEDTGEWFV